MEHPEQSVNLTLLDENWDITPDSVISNLTATLDTSYGGGFSLEEGMLASVSGMRSCSYCSKEFATLRSLKRHIKDKHLETTPVVCDVCGKVSKNKGALIVHKSSNHRRKQS